MKITTIDKNLSASIFRQWTEKINRGGLTIINDEVFIFVRRIEKAVQNILTKDFRDTMEKMSEKS